MARFVAILEDDANRIAAMRVTIASILGGIELAVFENAGAMIAWFKIHLDEVVLISLDHDLPLRDVSGCAVDFGTGRQVADYLAAIPPTCPVIVHSSNDHAASGMFFALKDGGWRCSRVYPCDDLAWIKSSWIAQVRRYLDDGWIAGGETLLNPR